MSNQQFYTLVTTTGKAKIANATALGTKINFSTLKAGDGNGNYYEPTENQQDLVRTVWTGPITSVSVDPINPNWIVIAVIVPANVGGFMIREVGIFDDIGTMIAIGKYPETYKPTSETGSTKDLTIKTILEVSNAASIEFNVDPNIIIATKKDIETLENEIKNIKVPVSKVNGKTGDVVLSTDDIGAAKQEDLINLQDKVNNLNTNDLEARDEIMDLKLKLKEQTSINLLNKTGVGFYDTFTDSSNIDTANTTAVYDSTNKLVDFPYSKYTAKATGDYTNIKILNVDSPVNVGDKVDNLNKILNSVIKDSSVTYDRTGITSVVNSVFVTSATTRPQVLSNGWIVTCAYDSANSKLYFYVDKNDGNGFIQLCFLSSKLDSFAITSYKTKIYLLTTQNTAAVNFFFSFDVTTVKNDNIPLVGYIDTSQTSFGTGCSIAVNSKGELTVAWCSKNGTYPNSFNIRSAKSIDGGSTWTKQNGTSGVDQATTGPNNSINPYVQYGKDDKPIITHQYYDGTNYFIWARVYFGSSWLTHTIYEGGSYSQSNAVTTLQKYGTNAGRIWVTWAGTDSIDNGVDNIRVSYSDDNGETWSSSQKLTSGNSYQNNPTVTSDIVGNVYILWQGKNSNGYYNIRQAIWNGTVWGNVTEVTNQSIGHMNYASTCDNYYNFEKPITIWQDLANNRVAFYGKWTAQIKTYDVTLENAITVTKDQQLDIYPPLKQLKMKDETFDTFNNLDLNLYVDKINKATIKGAVNNSTSVVTGATDKVLTSGDKLFMNGVLNQVLSCTDNFVTNTVTDATVINQTYGTSGNGGRKLVRSSNGWLVSALKDNSNNMVKLYMSKDNGSSFSSLFSITYSPLVDVSIIGITATNVLILCSANNTMTARIIDCVTGSQVGSLVTIDSQTAVGNCSLAINPQGTELHACWSSKNSTYPNSFNIRYCKGVINSDGSVTWGNVEQVTQANNSDVNVMNPSIICNSNSYPVIVCQNSQTTNYIDVEIWNGTSWIRNSTIYNGGSYSQSNPSAIFVPKEINGLANGRIWVVWQGTDSTDNNVTNIKVSYSDDNGVTWASAYKITSGNTYSFILPSITANKDNDIFIVFQNNNSSYGISKVRYSGTTWYSRTTIKNGGNHFAPSTLIDLTLDFTEPLFIYQDIADNKVGFYGTWTAKEGYNLTMQNPATLTDGQQVPIVDVEAKQNGQDLILSNIDSEKYNFKGSNLNTTTASIKVTGKNNKVNSLVYAIA